MFDVIIIFVSVLIVYYIILSYKKYKQFENISNGRYFFPLIGHLGIIFIEKIAPLAVIRCISDNGKLLPCLIWQGNYCSYVTNDAEETEILLRNKNSTENHYFYKFIKEYTDNALLTADAITWHRNRKLLSKAFNPRHLNSFFPVFSEKYQILTNIIQQKSEDIFETLSNYTMDVFLSTHIGISFDVQRQKIKLVDYITKMGTIATKRMLIPCYWKNYIFYNLSIGRKMKYLQNCVDTYLLKIVKDRRESTTRTFEDKSWKSFMDILIEPCNEFKFSDYDIVKELIVFITAGTATTANTIAMTCVLLGMHKNIQDNVYNEIIDVIGNDGEITSTDLRNLKYTEMVINESMRLFPSVPQMGRHLTGDIDIGTKILSKGLDVIISTFYVHRSEKYWPNPLKFDPNRFLPEEIAKRPAGSFIPFSEGPKNCLGATYAKMIIKYTVANIIRSYKLSSNYKDIDEIKVESHITLKPDFNLDVTFTPRL